MVLVFERLGAFAAGSSRLRADTREGDAQMASAPSAEAGRDAWYPGVDEGPA